MFKKITKRLNNTQFLKNTTTVINIVGVIAGVLFPIYDKLFKGNNVILPYLYWGTVMTLLIFIIMVSIFYWLENKPRYCYSYVLVFKRKGHLTIKHLNLLNKKYLLKKCSSVVIEQKNSKDNANYYKYIFSIAFKNVKGENTESYLKIGTLIDCIKADFSQDREIYQNVLIIQKNHFDAREVKLSNLGNYFIESFNEKKIKTQDDINFFINDLSRKEELQLLKANEEYKSFPSFHTFEKGYLDQSFLLLSRDYNIYRDYEKKNQKFNLEDKVAKACSYLKKEVSGLFNLKLESYQVRITLFYFNVNFNKLVPFLAYSDWKHKDKAVYNDINKIRDRTLYPFGKYHVGEAFKHEKVITSVLTDNEIKPANDAGYKKGWIRNLRRDSNDGQTHYLEEEYDFFAKHKTRSQVHIAIPISCHYIHNKDKQCQQACGGNWNKEEAYLHKCYVMCFDIIEAPFEINKKNCSETKQKINNLISEIKKKIKSNCLKELCSWEIVNILGYIPKKIIDNKGELNL